MGRFERATRKAWRWMRSRFSRRALIFMYHRVAECPTDPQALAVSPSRFAEHLQVLRRLARPTPLSGLTHALAAGEDVPAGAVAVTFDDGYADNLSLAYPLLERQAVPATVFVTTGAVGQGREFWWDALARLVLEPARLPPALDLPVPDGRLRWEARQNRRVLYRAARAVLQRQPEAAQRALLQALAAWTGADLAPRPENRALTIAELQALAATGLVEIGAHTVGHPLLAATPEDRQKIEIEASKRQLEDWLGRPVTSFAYPYGGPGSAYAPATVDLVRAAGFEGACSTFVDVVRRHSDRFQLPRLNVPATWSAGDVERALRQWLV